MENKDVIYSEDGSKIIYEFKGETVHTLTEEEEKIINSLVGAKGAICMDDKTILKPVEPIDYGVCKDINGNIVEEPPKPKFVRNSIFH